MYLNEVALVFYLSCGLIYVILMTRTKKKGTKSRHNIIKLILNNWVSQRFSDHNLALVVQALRNIIMGNSIFSSGLLILLGILVGLYESNLFDSETLLFSLKGLPIGLVKISFSVILIVFSLFNFILTIRMMNRLTLLFCAFPEKIMPDEIENLDIVEDSFKAGYNHLVLGTRGLFYLIPLLSWLIHPILFIVSTIGVTIYLIFFHDIRSSKSAD